MKSLREYFENLGDRLGLLELAQAPTPHSTPKISTRTITLAELATEIRSEEVRLLAAMPAELSISFDRIYEAAGVKIPAHGWTAERLRQILPSGESKSTDRTTVQKKILETLTSEGVDSQELVKDAIARDKALDSFEAFVGKKMEDRLAAHARRIAELESKVHDLQSGIAGLQEQVRVERENWEEWKAKKRAAEKELAQTVAYLIDDPLISFKE